MDTCMRRLQRVSKTNSINDKATNLRDTLPVLETPRSSDQKSSRASFTHEEERQQGKEEANKQTLSDSGDVTRLLGRI